MANDCIPFYRPGQDVTAQCSAAVTGKRFVKISGNRTSGPGLAATSEGSNYLVAPAAAGDRAFGVAKFDAPINAKVGVIVSGAIVPVRTGAALTAGQEVQSDATGQAIPLAAGKALGLAVNGAASAADVEVLLY